MRRIRKYYSCDITEDTSLWLTHQPTSVLVPIRASAVYQQLKRSCEGFLPFGNRPAGHNAVNDKGIAFRKCLRILPRREDR